MSEVTPRAAAPDMPILERISILENKLDGTQMELIRCIDRLSLIENAIGINNPKTAPRNY